jgi:membrane protein implicated in regulation of membrane protease activity
MDLTVWHIWIIIAVLLFILEIFTAAFLAACVAIGCIVAGLISYFDFGLSIQLIAFSVGTLASFFTVRPLMLKYAYRNREEVKTNVDALSGKIAKVIVTINNSQNEGRVKVEGDDWKAESENNEIINIGEKVEILKVKSTILIVKPITKN